MLLRPRWLAGHVLVLTAVVVAVALGFWQLGREQDRRDELDERRAAAAAPAPDLPAPATPIEAGSRVRVTGTYEPEPQFLLLGRVRDGEPGYDVVTVLDLGDGTAVAVDRGWVSRGEVERRGAPAPPGGVVVVQGTTAPSRGLQADDAVDARGPTRTLALPRVDLERIARERPAAAASLREVWIAAQSQDPRPRGGPALPEPQVDDRVDHIAYAIQWFSFALIAAVGWPIILRRAVRREQRRATGTPDRAGGAPAG